MKMKASSKSDKKSKSKSKSKRPLKTDKKSNNDSHTKKQKKDEISESNPVLEIELHNNRKLKSKAPSIDIMNSTNLLQDVMYPIEPSQFMNDYFRKKAVHISTQGKCLERIQDLIQEHMYNLDIESILTETSSDNVFVWLSPSSPSSSSSDKTNSQISTALRSIEISNPSTALSLHHAGHATYCRAPPLTEQYLVSSMLRSTGFGCGQYDPSGTKSTTLGRGEVEVFVGTKGHYTNWHFDFQENFTIQLSGKKRWRLKQGYIKYPMRGCTPHYYALNDSQTNHSVVESQLKSHRLSTPNFEFGRQNLSSNAYGEEQEIIMYPGDCLYFPAGMWHCVETIETGVSINVSLMATTYANVVCDALQHLLLKKDDWRETVTLMNDNHDGLLSKTRALLSELPNIVQDFVNNGGEQALFPPTLRYPPSFATSKDTEEQSFDDNDDADDADGDNYDEDSSDNDVAANENENDESESDDNDDTLTVDVDTFQAPYGWNWNSYNDTSKHQNVKLVKNPLATLTRMKDISSFYANLEKNDKDKTNDGHNDEDESKKEFVLNISYAGNEMHESAIRVVFYESAENSVLQKCAVCEKQGDDPATLFDHTPNNPDSNLPPLCLFYYGYFYWVRI